MNQYYSQITKTHENGYKSECRFEDRTIYDVRNRIFDMLPEDKGLLISVYVYDRFDNHKLVLMLAYQAGGVSDPLQVPLNFPTNGIDTVRSCG